MDDLVLDANTLFSIADIIDGYCARQREVVNVYYAQIMALESEWRDDETFETLVEELDVLRAQAIAIIDEVYETYPKYFRQRAQHILERPRFGEEGTYVPSSTASGATGSYGNQGGGGAAIGGGDASVTSGSAGSTADGEAWPSQPQGHSSGLTGDDQTPRSRGNRIGFWDWAYSKLGKKNTLESALRRVEYRPVQPASTQRTEDEIVNDLGGGDKTEGSCSSLAFAYVGNKAGYVVYDFRDGKSREVFASRDIIKKIATMQGVESKIEYGKNDGICAERLMTQMERGKEYYMATGRHAAIVRLKADGGYQYLELQSETPSDNGWQPLTQRALYDRFVCSDHHQIEWSNYLIKIDSLKSNVEFLHLLGYINTDRSAQVKGGNGNVKQ